MLQNERVARRRSGSWESSAYLGRWGGARPQRPPCRRRICRRGPRPRPRSHSVRKKSPTSAWRRSTSSTRKTPERLDLGKNLLEAAAAAAAAADALESAAAAAAAGAAAGGAGGGVGGGGGAFLW